MIQYTAFGYRGPRKSADGVYICKSAALEPPRSFCSTAPWQTGHGLAFYLYHIFSPILSSVLSPGIVNSEQCSSLFLTSPNRSRPSSIPLVERSEVPDTEARNVPSLPVLKGAITALARLAYASARGGATAWLFSGDLPDLADEAMEYAQIWCKRAYSCIEKIFLTCPKHDQWWVQLKHKVYNWLTLKHNVLEYAGRMFGVAPSDIADQIVNHLDTGSQSELNIARGLTIEHPQYGIDIDALVKILSLVSRADRVSCAWL